MTVSELFSTVGLSPHGPVKWGDPVPERDVGVYVVALVADTNATCEVDATYLPAVPLAR